MFLNPVPAVEASTFLSTKTANKEVVSTGNDPNHFTANYFGKGFRWQLPDLYRSEIAYRLARLAFEQNKREIVDATVGGKLDIFRKVNFEEILQEKQ